MASPLQALKSGAVDVFVTTINAAGSTLIFSTYLGGSGGDAGYGIAVDGAGNAHVTGATSSPNFPTVAPLQPSIGATQDAFVLTIAGAGGTVGPAAPSGLVATATATNLVEVSWNPSPGAVSYHVDRLADGSWITVALSGTTINDPSVQGGKTYVYRVRAVDSLSQVSPDSVPDAATTIFFSSDPLVAGSTVVLAAHIRELRQATNAMRTAAGQPTIFTDPFLDGAPIRANHIDEVRFQLTEARSALGLLAIAYSETLVAGATVVKAIHVQELRASVK